MTHQSVASFATLAALLAAACSTTAGGPPAEDPADAAMVVDVAPPDDVLPPDGPETGDGPDLVVLVDGTRLRGTIVGEDEAFVTLRSDGTTRAHSRGRIAVVERGPDPAPAEVTDEAGKPRRERRGKGERKRDGSGRAAAAALGEDARRWLDTLVDHLGHEDPLVRRSATAALRALGPAAAGPLREAAEATKAAGGEQHQLLARLADAAERPAAPRSIEGNWLKHLQRSASLTDAEIAQLPAVLLAAGKELGRIRQEARGSDGTTALEPRVAAVRDGLIADLTRILGEERTAATVPQIQEHFARLAEQLARQAGEKQGRRPAERGRRKTRAP